MVMIRMLPLFAAGTLLLSLSACQHTAVVNTRVQRVRPDERGMEMYEAPGATVRVADPIVGRKKNLAAGFTEYLKPSRLEWTFTYDEVFFMLEGELSVQEEGFEPVKFEVGDLGYLPKGTRTLIVVPEHALLLHLTQPAWQD